MAHVTAVADLDEEQLLRHFCLEKEAKMVSDWCGANGHKRPTEFEARLAAARELREEGNARFKKEEWADATWRYLVALHMLDFSQKDKVLAGVAGGDTPNRIAVFDELLSVRGVPQISSFFFV